jgi:hypothetical protein
MYSTEAQFQYWVDTYHRAGELENIAFDLYKKGTDDEDEIAREIEKVAAEYRRGVVGAMRAVLDMAKEEEQLRKEALEHERRRIRDLAEEGEAP